MMDLLDRIPPQSLEAEMSAIHSMLLDVDAADRVTAILQPEHFYNEANAAIFDVARKLIHQSRPLDFVTLSEALTKGNQLERIGGMAYLAQVALSVPSAANAEYYAQIVRDKANLRRLLSAASGMIEAVYQSQEPVNAIVSDAIGSVEKILEGEFVEEQTIASTFEAVLEQIRIGKPAPFYPSGYADWDNHIGGLTLGETIVVGGLTSSGKTTLGLNLARNVALLQGVPTAYVSYEMRKLSLVSRLVAQICKIPAWGIRKGLIPESQYGEICRLVGGVADKRLYVAEAFGVPLEDLLLRLKIQIRKKGVKFFVLDHLHRIPTRKQFKDKRTELTSAINLLTTFSAEQGVSMVALAQLSRAAYNADELDAQHLRESSDIEQMADVVVMLEDEDYKAPTPIHSLKCRVVKNREGVSGGEFKFTWFRDTGRLESRTEKEVEDYANR